MRPSANSVVRRQLTFRPGEPLPPEPPAGEPAEAVQPRAVPVREHRAGRHRGASPTPCRCAVTVTKSNHKKVNFGVGYGSEEKARARDRLAPREHLRRRADARLSARYSSLDRGVRLTFKEPYSFSPRWRSASTARSGIRASPPSTSTRRGGRVTVTRQFARAGGPVLGGRPAMALSLYLHQRVRGLHDRHRDRSRTSSLRDELIALGLDPTATARARGQRSALSASTPAATRPTTCSTPSAATWRRVHLEQAGRGLRGDLRLREVSTEGRITTSSGTSRLSPSQVRGGIIGPNGDAEHAVPFFKRYFLGGATNLRGWGRFEVAPLSAERACRSAARASSNASLEVRAPIWGEFERRDVPRRRQRVGRAVGPSATTRLALRRRPGSALPDPDRSAARGLRLSAESDRQLSSSTASEKQRRFRFHFSIGQAF